MQKFDSYDVLTKLTSIANSKPAGFVYKRDIDGCVNTAKDPVTGEYVPSCIIGHLFVELGIPADVLPKHGAVNTLTHHTEGKFEFTKVAVQLMRIVQLMQDSGVPWIAAVKCARDLVNNSVYNPLTQDDVVTDDTAHFSSDV